MHFNTKLLFILITTIFFSFSATKMNGQKTITADGIELAFVTDFDIIYGDFGTGAHSNMSIWKPKVPQGFYALGYYAHASHAKPTTVMFAVRSNGDNTALRHPVDYKFVWNDGGTGGDWDGTIWEPIAPDGYKAMGTVAVRGYHKPALTEVVCVREDLTTYASVGRAIWNDSGSGGDRDGQIFRIKAPATPQGSKKSYIASGSFCGHASYAKLASSEAAFALKVTMPYRNKTVNIKLPKLTGLGTPIKKTNMQLESVSYIPCISVKDRVFANNLARQVQETPIYKLERYVYYQLMDHNTSSSENDGTMSFRLMTGMSQEHTTEMNQTFGVETTVEGGVEAGIYSASVSVTVSYALSQTESYTKSEVSEREKSVEFTVPGKGAGALYGKTYLYKLKRANGEVIKSWELHTKQTHFTDFVPAKQQKPVVKNTPSGGGFKPVNGQGRTIKTNSLEIASITDFKKIYTDSGTGGDMDLSIWAPNLPQGFYALGHYAHQSYNSPTRSMAVVKSLDQTAIAYPVDYRYVWDDKGSGGNQDVSLWEPIPPAGYKALGTVASLSYNKPALDAVVCVRADLVASGQAGQFIYKDSGTGADRDLSLWNIQSQAGYMASGSFGGHASHGQLNGSEVVNVLKIGGNPSAQNASLQNSLSGTTWAYMYKGYEYDIRFGTNGKVELLASWKNVKWREISGNQVQLYLDNNQSTMTLNFDRGRTSFTTTDWDGASTSGRRK